MCIFFVEVVVSLTLSANMFRGSNVGGTHSCLFFLGFGRIQKRSYFPDEEEATSALTRVSELLAKDDKGSLGEGERLHRLKRSVAAVGGEDEMMPRYSGWEVSGPAFKRNIASLASREEFRRRMISKLQRMRYLIILSHTHCVNVKGTCQVIFIISLLQTTPVFQLGSPKPS